MACHYVLFHRAWHFVHIKATMSRNDVIKMMNDKNRTFQLKQRAGRDLFTIEIFCRIKFSGQSFTLIFKDNYIPSII